MFDPASHPSFPTFSPSLQTGLHLLGYPTQENPISTLQVESQPSPLKTFESSQDSPESMIPFEQVKVANVQSEGLVGDPGVHVQLEFADKQPGLHPLPLLVPSSHDSPMTTLKSPHIGMHTVGFPEHEYSGFDIMQLKSHPIPPSSQDSDPAKIASPQNVEQIVGFPPQIQPEREPLQVRLHPIPPSSHVSNPT